MKMPWDGAEGWGKATAVFAAILLVSLGLCGLNLVAFTGIGALNRGGSAPGAAAWAAPALTVTGVIELAGIVIGGLGLLVVGLLAIAGAIVRSIRGGNTNRREP